jgi:hypothetical protein
MRVVKEKQKYRQLIYVEFIYKGAERKCYENEKKKIKLA